jgi:uncharacterized protein DUF3649
MNVLKPVSQAWHWPIFSRVVAASLGTYLLVNLANLALGYLLPGAQYRALLFAMQISFLLYTLAIIWVFSVRSAAKAWLGLAALAIPLAIVDAGFYFLGAA